MGTLFEQRPRWERMKEPGYSVFIAAEHLSGQYGISFENALKCIELDFKIDDYDSKDEQLAGFGELLEQLVEVLEKYEHHYIALLESQMEDWEDENSIH